MSKLVLHDRQNERRYQVYYRRTRKRALQLKVLCPISLLDSRDVLGAERFRDTNRPSRQDEDSFAAKFGQLVLPSSNLT
jgi:hypothetical protein